MKQPNILFILSDDQGAWAMGCAGNNEIITPNLDTLAKEGILFNNYFCTCPVCSPARASILTGRIPSQHGVHDWISSGNINFEDLSEDMKKRQALKRETIPIQYLEGQPAYTDYLKQAGYTCGLSGKWHLGDSITPQKGFDYWQVIAKGGCNYYQSEIIKDDQVVLGEKYITDIITDNAITFLEKEKDNNQPFYLSVHYTAPHSPWNKENHPDEIWQLYEDCAFDSVPDLPQHPWLIDAFKSLEGEKRKEALRGYYTAVTAMDRGIGQLLDKLDELHLREDTLIIFTSDNGMNMGHHGIFGKGNGTFPLNLYDTSVKVPMIMSLPKKEKSNTTCKAMLSHYDIMPTLLDYLGLDMTSCEGLPGKSFADLLRDEGGEGADSHEEVVIYDEYGPARMIRTREWKYIHRYPYGPHELYDLIDDPDENKNLIDDTSKANMQAQLRCQLRNWFLKYTIPTMDGRYEPVTGNGQVNMLGSVIESF